MYVRFQNIWKYHYTPGMHQTVTLSELLINLDVWNSLPKSYQTMIEVACMDAFVRHWINWQRMNAIAMKKFVDEYDVKIMRTPDDILKEFLETWDIIAAETAAKNPFFKKVWESQKAYASLVVPAKRFMFPPYKFAADHYWPPKSVDVYIPPE